MSVTRLTGTGQQSDAERNAVVYHLSCSRGDLRTLGYADGMAWALMWVKQEIDRIIDQSRPNPAHRHKVAEHERRLAPLRELERRTRAAYDEASAAFDQSTKQTTT
jgi:hypothetical protein